MAAPSFRMCVDAVGGMRSEVCQGDVCGPRLETDNLWVNHQQLLPACVGDATVNRQLDPRFPLSHVAIFSQRMV